MKNYFISNLNSSYRVSDSESANQLEAEAFSQKLDEAQTFLGSSPVLMAGWSDPASRPDCSLSYRDLMINQDSEADSIGVVAANFVGGKALAELNVDNSSIIKDSEAKYLLLLTEPGYKEDGKTKLVNGNLCLVIDSFDAASGLPKVKSLNGAKYSPDDEESIIPPISKGAVFVMLTDIPEGIFENRGIANTFILKRHCPAIREDARRGDIFCFSSNLFGGLAKSPFIKLYSFQDKIDAMLRQPNKTIKALNGDDEECRVYFSNSLDIPKHESCYILLMQDIENSRSEVVAQSEDADASASSVDTDIIKKGSFFFLKYDSASSKYIPTQVPFDLFFQ